MIVLTLPDTSQSNNGACKTCNNNFIAVFCNFLSIHLYLFFSLAFLPVYQFQKLLSLYFFSCYTGLRFGGIAKKTRENRSKGNNNQ